MRRISRSESFETFYYKKVGLGEACGCAERIIDAYEFDRKAALAGCDHKSPNASFLKSLKKTGRKLWGRIKGLA